MKIKIGKEFYKFLPLPSMDKYAYCTVQEYLNDQLSIIHIPRIFSVNPDTQ